MLVTLDGSSLTIKKMQCIMYENANLVIKDDAWERVQTSYDVVSNAVENNSVIYGITTGFGSLRNCVVSQDETHELQVNLIKSHAVGVGNPIPIERVRGMLALRINTLIKGYSGVSPSLIAYLCQVFNIGVFSKVPEQGSVGASGDLAPLSHLVVGYLGEGELYDPEFQQYFPANDVLLKYNINIMPLGPKEGLALNNGTAFMTTHLADAVYNSKILISTANTAAALTVEALHGTHRAFHNGISQARPHRGQVEVASQMRDLLTGSQIYNIYAKDKVQDAYSLRCIPQVHGAVLDTLSFVKKITTTELNSATDNPLIIGTDVVSGGNFHGMPIALAADYLGIALTSLGNISERRIERLVNSNLSGLPSFLIDKGSKPGLHSGMMIVQYTAAALAAENRQLSSPSSVHTIPTCENQEDHVSMGPWGCRKLLQILANTQKIIAIELLCAVQAKEFTQEPTTPILEVMIAYVRNVVPRVTQDRYMHTDIEKIIALVQSGKLV